MALKDEWLNERKKGIGGSDAAALCGLSPYKTPLQLWEEKRGLLGQKEDNEAMLWGRTLEPVIRQRYSDVTGRPVRLPTEILRHPTNDFMLANIDGFTDDSRGVEIKTTAYPKDWGEPGTDEIPVGYIFQVQHYMIITGFPVFDVPVLIGGRDFRIYEVPADKELQEMLIQKEAEFWEMVKYGTPPPPVNYQDVVRLYRQSEEKTVTATEEIEGFIKDLREARAMIEEYKLHEELMKKQIMETMKEADTLIDLKGNILATWKTGKPTKEYIVKAKEAQRRFLLKEEKNGN